MADIFLVQTVFAKFESLRTHFEKFWNRILLKYFCRQRYTFFQYILLKYFSNEKQSKICKKNHPLVAYTNALQRSLLKMYIQKDGQFLQILNPVIIFTKNFHKIEGSCLYFAGLKKIALEKWSQSQQSSVIMQQLFHNRK